MPDRPPRPPCGTAHPGAATAKPRVVVLCGGTRFRAEYAKAFYDEEHAGRICLSVPCYKDDACRKTPADRARLDALRLHKIDMADEVLVLNVGGYTGTSTRNEIAYATRAGEPVRYLETHPDGPPVIDTALPPPPPPSDAPAPLTDDDLTMFDTLGHAGRVPPDAGQVKTFIAEVRRPRAALAAAEAGRDAATKSAETFAGQFVSRVDRRDPRWFVKPSGFIYDTRAAAIAAVCREVAGLDRGEGRNDG